MTDIIDGTETAVGERGVPNEKPLFADITLSPEDVVAHMPADLATKMKQLLEARKRGEDSMFPEEYFRTKYGVETIERAKRIVQKLVTSLYIDIPYTVTITREQDDSEISGGHDYQPGTGHAFFLETSSPPSQATDNPERHPILMPNEHVMVSPRILDLVKMIHEYTHAIYEETANKEHVPDDLASEYMTVSGMLNEGFTTFIEVESCTHLIQHAESYGLSKADVIDLTNIQNEIRKTLASHIENFKKPTSGYEKAALFQNMAYSEGYDFMKRLYDAKGMPGIIEFVSRIDIHKVKQIRRSSQEYHAAFKSIDGMSALALAPAEHN